MKMFKLLILTVLSITMKVLKKSFKKGMMFGVATVLMMYSLLNADKDAFIVSLTLYLTHIVANILSISKSILSFTAIIINASLYGLLNVIQFAKAEEVYVEIELGLLACIILNAFALATSKDLKELKPFIKNVFQSTKKGFSFMKEKMTQTNSIHKKKLKKKYNRY